jgi:uncharacterized membrane protein YfcA
LLVLLSVGTALGASLLVRAPEGLVGAAVIASFIVSLLAERLRWRRLRLAAFPVLALGAGATSGFSGTSGPLKGAALRNLELDREHFVGAASLASLAGDLTKAAIFAEASLLNGSSLSWAGAAVPSMLVGTFLGRRLNRTMGEQAFAMLFWIVMGGYSIRLVSGLL